ncbi:hypothetical protein KNU21_gp55 [Gordonia phage Nordenberg]|uniref:Uncharacterized protein n=2 Tax=Vividuovirus TaxID=2560251 RepID=A0A142K9W1_9CAUD|nr:hypothetical protein BJD57_gp62 [Gordonia phage Vivi2]YP_010099470.1 hypothetical protein KNU21_gp55 [Gordonia phage Nordenberg]AMS02894.1 hypothetical protein SEA_VIVI2_62 [Gordonia phage Vivi2]AYR03118.1 hypothetical protein SEA_NORDENBERG_55 [Gordonia phage Nordenberg]QDH92700.1 hypothetical protein SEA_CHARMING_60 [Gordonia phage Charming]
MTDHRTTAENDLARAIHALADAIATHARQFDPDAANRFLINPVRPKAGQ